MNIALLAALEARANVRGIVLAREETICRDLSMTDSALTRGIAELEANGAIDVLAPLPFLVARLRKWSGKESKSLQMGPKSGALEVRAYSFQSSLSGSKQLDESYRQPDTEAALLTEILETLGESDPTTFRGAVSSYPPGVIRTALGRVRRMKHIRKNRTAAFRFLLPRIAKESSSSN